MVKNWLYGVMLQAEAKLLQISNLKKARSTSLKITFVIYCKADFNVLLINFQVIL